MYCYNLLLYIAAGGVPGGGPGGVRGAGMSGGVIGGVPGGVPGRFSNSSGGVLGTRTPPGNHLPCADGGVSGDIGLSLTSIHDLSERARDETITSYEVQANEHQRPHKGKKDMAPPTRRNTSAKILGPSRFRRRFRNGHIRPQKGSGRQDWDDGRQLLKLQNAKVSVHFRTWPSDTALELHVVRPERAIFSSKGKVEDKTGMMGDNS